MVAPGTQTPQIPVPLHTVPPSTAQAVPAASGGFEGTPAVHSALVHALVLGGRSALSAMDTMFPAPSHSLSLQSPAVCVAITVPFATYVIPHAPLVHVTVAHAVVVPAQSLAVTQPMHAPVALHFLVPPQAVPDATSVGTTEPVLLQLSVTHGLVLVGASLGSATEMTLPLPSHTFFKQSPGVCNARAVPLAVSLTPQAPLVHVGVEQAVVGPQSDAARQATQFP